MYVPPPTQEMLDGSEQAGYSSDGEIFCDKVVLYRCACGVCVCVRESTNIQVETTSKDRNVGCGKNVLIFHAFYVYILILASSNLPVPSTGALDEQRGNRANNDHMSFLPLPPSCIAL